MKPETPFPTLVELANPSFPVYASASVQPKARQIADLCRHAHAYLSGLFDFTPSIRVLVLAPDDWRDLTDQPTYGMAHYTGSQTLVVAGEDNAFWQSMTPPVDELPAPAAAVMRAAYGQPSGELHLPLFFDLLAVHELSHLFHDQADVNFPRLWLMELFCNLCLHTYVAQNAAGKLPALEAFPAVVVAGGMSHLRYHTLEDFERLYGEVGPQNYGWYECHLHMAAKDIYDSAGAEALQRLWAAFRLSNATFTDDELGLLLDSEVHPAVAEVWRKWPK